MSESPSFEAKLRRLKECAGMSADQEVAAALGMTKSAFSVRKLRDSFPDEKLFVFAAKRPELGIDVTYVLTGDRSIQGPARAALENTARFFGTMQVSDMATYEELATRLVKATQDAVRLRSARRDVYDQLLSRLDQLTERSLALVLDLADRLALADVVEARRVSVPAAETGSAPDGRGAPSPLAPAAKRRKSK